MTPNEAKRIIQTELEKRHLPFTKLTAHTVNFIDLARAATIFVKIHGWQPNAQWDDLAKIARENDFRLDSN